MSLIDKLSLSVLTYLLIGVWMQLSAAGERVALEFGHLFPLKPINLVLALMLLLGMTGIRMAVSDSMPRPFGRSLPVLRGRKLISPSAAARQAKRLTKRSPETLKWAGIVQPIDVARHHFAIVGATGSGKTTIIRELQQSVVSQICFGANRRAIVYDPKRDSYDYLAQLIPEDSIVIFDPFDARATAWDIGKDIGTVVGAQQLADSLIPKDERSTHPFFDNAARRIIKGIVLALIRTKGSSWTFKDLIVATRSAETLREILESEPENAGTVDAYYSNEVTLANVLATLTTRLAPFEPIAAAWAHCAERLSLAEFLRMDAVLILGHDESCRGAYETINQLIVQRLGEYILGGPESLVPTTWLFLDEIREAGHLAILGRLLTKGRSKGAAVVIGFQDVEGLRAVYGDKEANEIIGQCGNKALLRLESVQTAEWASAQLGTQEVVSVSQSRPLAASGLFSSNPANENRQLVLRPVVLPSEFMTLRPAGKASGVAGFFVSPTLGTYFMTLRPHWPTLDVASLPQSLNFVPRPDEHQYLVCRNEEAAQQAICKDRPPLASDKKPSSTLAGLSWTSFYEPEEE